MLKRLSICYFFIALNLINNSYVYAEEITVPVSDDNELIVQKYSAKGESLIIWVAPEYGFRQNHRSLAKTFASMGIEVWQSNVLESLFLTQGTQSQKLLTGHYIADMIEYAYKTTGKNIILAGDSYASVSVLRAARQWQTRDIKKDYLIGAVLFSPYAYAYVPPLGMPPEYLPIIDATNIPLVIFQAQHSGIIGQFNTLFTKLQQHNNPVYLKKIPGVMSLFYQKQATPKMIDGANNVAASINKMISLLSKHKPPQQSIALSSSTDNKSGIDIYLKEFKGNTKPQKISLYDTNGDKFEKNQFKGKVTVINFWATWCPPCVEEIPSLNRLKKKMQGKDFELISINYAEDKAVIDRFMKKINVEFTVLLDQNGIFAKQWNVISYPSTFIIDRDGIIKYGVNAAIEWDNAELVKKIQSML